AYAVSAPSDLRQRRADVRVVLVTLQIGVEDVVPQLAGHRSGLDARQVDAVLLEHSEDTMQRASFVGSVEDDARLVAAGRCWRVMTQDEETGGVVRAVLDPAL